MITRAQEDKNNQTITTDTEKLKIIWQGIVFTNQTFDEELSFDVSELERIFDNNSYLFEPS